MQENLGILEGDFEGDASSLMCDSAGRCFEEDKLRCCCFFGDSDRSSKALLRVLRETLRIDWPPLTATFVASC